MVEVQVKEKDPLKKEDNLVKKEDNLVKKEDHQKEQYK